MLCFRLTILSLAAICSLMAAVASRETVITCGNDKNVQRLSCAYGVIRVKTALFGRQDSETCSTYISKDQLSNTECSASGTDDILKDRCDGRKECELNIDDVNNPDPCSDTFKYLNTTYGCIPATHLIACEGSVAHLQCTHGRKIFVYAAYYGRTNRDTCSFKQPGRKIRKTDCFYKVTDTVSDSCNGKSSCTISVEDDLIKSISKSCRKTYKYLEAAYVCKYPYAYYYRSGPHGLHNRHGRR